MNDTLNVGCIGIGGYAAALIGHFANIASDSRVRLAVVCTSRPQAVKDNPDLTKLDPTVVAGPDDVVRFAGLDAVIIPTSIESHLPYTRAALEQGLHVLVEKPVTGTVQDAHAMIEARDKAGLLVAVGYQDHYATISRWAKRKILDGEIGEVKRVKVQATWPRPDSYYARADWAGAVKRNGGWVLDSPANNALAHEINMALYLTGPTFSQTNRATRVTAELYRARDIENFDTCAIRCRTATGPEVLILLTHACREIHGPILEVIGESGILHRSHRRRFELRRNGQIADSIEQHDIDPRAEMFTRFISRIRGDEDAAVCEIENALAPLEVVNAASQCAPVKTIDASQFHRVAHQPDKDPDDCVHAIENIEQVFADCFERFDMPHQHPDVSWATEPRSMDLEDDFEFTGLAEG